MRRWLGLVLAAGMLASVPGAALATRTEPQPVECPNCGRGSQALRVVSTNTYGGIDADGCRNANGEPPHVHLVHVCPACLCARVPGEERRAPAGEAAKRFLEERLAARAGAAGPPEFGTLEKFELAALLIAAEGDRPGVEAAVWLRAAWALRGEARAALLHPEHGWDDEVPPAWREVVSAATAAEQSLPRTLPGTRTVTGREVAAALALAEPPFPEGTDPRLRRLHAAAVLRCHGELVRAEAVLAPLRSEPPAADEAAARWIDATASSLARGLSDERDVLRKVLRAAEAVGPGGGSANDLLVVSECRRRLGEDEEAARQLERALPGLPLPELVLLRDAAEWAGQVTPLWRAAVAAAWEARRADLLGRLGSPDAGPAAAAALAQLADPEALPGLAAAVGDEDPLRAANAATALAGYETVPEGVVETAERRAADPDEDAELRWAALDALVAWAPERSAPVFRTVLDREDDAYLHEAAARGLGLTGDPGDASRLLAAKDAEPEVVAGALSLLAGVPFGSPEEFEAWREEREEVEAGEDWGLDALRAAAVGLAGLDDPAAPAILVECLENPSLPVRWQAFRALRALTGVDLGRADVRYVGRVQTPEAGPDELDLAHVLGDGWIVSSRDPGPGFDLDQLGSLLQPLRDRDGARRWARAAARYRDWLERRRR